MIGDVTKVRLFNNNTVPLFPILLHDCFRFYCILVSILTVPLLSIFSAKDLSDYNYTMKDKLPPKTGLDFGAMMDEIDDQEELKKESENVKELLGQVKKAASDLEASFETMVIEAFGMDETASSIQEASWKIKWALDRIDLALERMNETKYTVQLDDKSVLTVNDLHRELVSDQKLALEEYKLEQKELFSQYKQDLKSITAGQGLWLSSKALAVALVVFELLLVVVGVVVYYWTKSKFT